MPQIFKCTSFVTNHKHLVRICMIVVMLKSSRICIFCPHNYARYFFFKHNSSFLANLNRSNWVSLILANLCRSNFTFRADPGLEPAAHDQPIKSVAYMDDVCASPHNGIAQQRDFV